MSRSRTVVFAALLAAGLLAACSDTTAPSSGSCTNSNMSCRETQGSNN